MKKLLAGAIAVGVVSTAGVLGNGTSAAETALLVGGAKAPGVPWYDYTLRAGRLYYPDTPPGSSSTTRLACSRVDCLSRTCQILV